MHKSVLKTFSSTFLGCLFTAFSQSSRVPIDTKQNCPQNQNQNCSCKSPLDARELLWVFDQLQILFPKKTVFFITFLFNWQIEILQGTPKQAKIGLIHSSTNRSTRKTPIRCASEEPNFRSLISLCWHLRNI